MEPIRHIRKQVLRQTQVEFAAVAGVSQATVSKWESGKCSPARDELKRIRSEAISRGIEWDDGWLFDAPEGAAA